MTVCQPCDAELLKKVFPQLARVLVEQVVVDEGPVVRVVARTRADPVACPRCGALASRVHGYHRRHLADLPVAGRPVMIELRVRRLVCDNLACGQRTFREQVPDLAERYARRTPGLGALIGTVGLVLAGKAASRLLSVFAVAVSGTAVLHLVMALPVSTPTVPQVLSVDDFALRRGRRYATLLIDAVTHRRIDVLPDRKADTLTAWLRTHPGARFVVRDGSAAYAEAIRQGAPTAVQICDRWHVWALLVKAVEKTVNAHAACWHTGPPRCVIAREERTRARHAAVHALLDQGVGLLECARRTGWALNTVKRYARATSVEELLRPPQYRTTLVDPYRDHIRRRLAEEPDLPRVHLLAEIRRMGYPGSDNLFWRYLKHGPTPSAMSRPRAA